MKIGILTYHCVANFGAQLQVLSTVCYLRNHGHEPIVIHWYPEDLENIYSWISSEQLDTHIVFTEKFLPLSALCRTEEELVSEVEKLELDSILLGSDALFKYIPIRNRWYIKMGKYKPRLIHVNTPSVEKLHGNPFFGGFLSKLSHRIPASVYAVSTQNTPFDKMSVFERRLMKSCLMNFRMISVRDTWTQKMVCKVAGLSQIDIFPDPVFAFNNNASEFVPNKATILEKYNIKGDYLLLSFRTGECSDSYVQSLAAEAKSVGLTPIALTMPEGVCCADVQPQISTPLSPIDWYSLIKYSSGYIGERMHPIVVALHNAVPCFSFDEYGTSIPAKVIFPRIGTWSKDKSKIYHIMKEAQLESNWYAYASKEPLPTPNEVLQRILSFDREKCKLFSERQASQYENGMQKIIESYS